MCMCMYIFVCEYVCIYRYDESEKFGDYLY